MLSASLTLLKENIDQRIAGTDRRRGSYRRKSFRVFISTTILASISTVLIGAFAAPPEPVRVLLLVIGTAITIISSCNAFFNFKELWVANNDALNRLYGLRFKIEFYEKANTPPDDKMIEGWKDEYQSILNDLNQVWHKSRSDSHA